MGTDAQESGALICRCSWKPLFHCQAQLVSNQAPRPWQRGFPSSPDHTEGWEARREGPKAAPPGVSPFSSLPEAVTTESEGRKDGKRQLGLHLSLFLPVFYLFLCKPEAATTAGGSGLAVPALCLHTVILSSLWGHTRHSKAFSSKDSPEPRGAHLIFHLLHSKTWHQFPLPIPFWGQ